MKELYTLKNELKPLEILKIILDNLGKNFLAQLMLLEKHEWKLVYQFHQIKLNLVEQASITFVHITLLWLWWENLFKSTF